VQSSTAHPGPGNSEATAAVFFERRLHMNLKRHVLPALAQHDRMLACRQRMGCRFFLLEEYAGLFDDP